MHVLVTGGNGFIGSRLCRVLSRAGHRVTSLDTVPRAMDCAEFIPGDIRDAHALSRVAGGTGAIFHLAAEHRDDVRPATLYNEVNVGGARNIVVAARHGGCRRIIFTSTVAVYPLNFPGPTESTPPRPFNEYGRSKLEAEHVLRQWAMETPGATLVVVRLCVVFGEGNRGNVYNLVAQIYRRRFVMVGDGRNRKSLAYVGNVVNFLSSCLAFPPGIHVLNYADKPDLSVRELLAIVHRALGRREPEGRFRLPYWLGLCGGTALDWIAELTGRRFPISAIRIKKFCADTTVATEVLEAIGFVRPFSLEEALVRTIQHEFPVIGEKQVNQERML